MTSVESPMVADSSISGDDADTQTLSDSLLEYPEHWGRTYHRYNAGTYRYPNDAEELDRLDYLHDIFTRIHQGHLFFAPVQAARKVLDLGTGTGIWPIELADSKLLPDATITGIDLSPTQPNTVPENVRFEIQDCTDNDWHREPGTYDYIHVRMMLGAFVEPWEVIRNAKRYLRPGTGWLEWHDFLPVSTTDDNSIPPRWPLVQFENNLNRGSNRLGVPLRIADKIKGWMKEAGFVDIHEHINKLPIGKWPKDKELKLVGAQWAEAMRVGLSAIAYKVFSEGLSWSRNEIEVDLVGVRNAMAQRGVHAYHKLYVVYGRRPSPEEEGHLRRFKQPRLAKSNGVPA